VRLLSVASLYVAQLYVAQLNVALFRVAHIRMHSLAKSAKYCDVQHTVANGILGKL